MRRATLWSAALGVTVGLFALPAVADGPSVPGPYQPSCPIRGQFIPRADGWTQVQIPSGLAFLGGLSVRPDDERTLYANDHQSVYRSTDGGCHWASVFTLPAYVAPAPALPGQASGLEPAVIDSVHVAPRWDPRQAAPVWVTATLGSGSTGQSAVWYSPTGAGSFSSAGGGLAGHVRALVPVAQGAVALVDPAATLALPGAPASGEQVYIGTTRTVSGTSSTTWAPGGSTGLGRIDGIAADATAVPAVVYAWSGAQLVRSVDGGASFGRPLTLAAPISALDPLRAGRSLAYLADGQRLLVDNGSAHTLPAVGANIGAVTSATHALVNDTPAVSTASADWGLGPRGWTPITPVGPPVQHLQLAGLDETPVLYGMANGMILFFPLSFPTQFVRVGGPAVVIYQFGSLPPVSLRLHRPSIAPPGAPTLAPAAVTLNLPPGGRRQVPYDFAVPPHPGPLDVYFLVDTTGSMGPSIDGMRLAIANIISSLVNTGANVEFGLGDFKDYGDTDPPAGGSGLPLVNPLNPPKPHIYQRDRAIGPADATLVNALNSLVPGGGGDDPEAQTIAVIQAITGRGMPNFVAPTNRAPVGDESRCGPAAPCYITPGQEAGFRADATKVVVLVTDAPFNDQGSYPSIPEAAAVARAYGVKIVGLVPDTGDQEAATTDMDALVAGSGTLAPAGGVDCAGTGSVDVPAGRPLVCQASMDGSGLENVGAPLIALLSEAIDPAPVAVSLDTGRAVVSRLVGQTAAVTNLRRVGHLRFAVDFACSRADSGRTVPVRLSGSVAGTVYATASALVHCGTPAPPPVLPLAALVHVAAVIVVPPPPLPPAPPQVPNTNPNVQYNPNAGAAAEEEQQPQVAIAQNEAEEPDASMAFSTPARGDPRALYGGAAALTLLAAGLALGLSRRTAPALARVGVGNAGRRVRRRRHR